MLVLVLVLGVRGLAWVPGCADRTGPCRPATTSSMSHDIGLVVRARVQLVAPARSDIVVVVRRRRCRSGSVHVRGRCACGVGARAVGARACSDVPPVDRQVDRRPLHMHRVRVHVPTMHASITSWNVGRCARTERLPRRRVTSRESFRVVPNPTGPLQLASSGSPSGLTSECSTASFDRL